MATRRLIEQFLTFDVALVSVMSDGRELDYQAADRVYDIAYERIDEACVKLPCNRRPLSGAPEVEVPAFELCEPDGQTDDDQYGAVWPVCLFNTTEISPEVVEAMQALVLKTFTEVAHEEQLGAVASIVRIQRQNVFQETVNEVVTLDDLRASAPAAPAAPA